MKILDLEALPAAVGALVTPKESSVNSGLFTKKALTREDLIRLAQSFQAQGLDAERVIRAPRGTIVTPLCRDLAREMGIAIEIVEKS